MAGLLDLTAELPVWAVAAVGAGFFLLGVGTKAAARLAVLVTRRWARSDRCARCRTAGAHQARINRPARAGWPGWHTTSLPVTYGLTPPHPPEPPPETVGTDTWPLDSPIPVPPPKRAVPAGTGKLTKTLHGPLSWVWDDTAPPAIPVTGPMAVGLVALDNRWGHPSPATREMETIR